MSGNGTKITIITDFYYEYMIADAAIIVAKNANVFFSKFKGDEQKWLIILPIRF